MSKHATKARQIRDKYAEMMRLENPDFGFLSMQDMRYALESIPMSKPKAKKLKPYKCMTQTTGAIDELFLGQNKGTIELWENGSIINWTARFDSFPTRRNAQEAAVATWRACEEWNKVLDGRVTFRYVASGQDAAFQVRYGGNFDAYAMAFFPSAYKNTLNSIDIYSLSFQPSQKAEFIPTMLHELGHVLGLRHEHSQNLLPGRPSIEDEDPALESILWGIRNPRSVMAYYPLVSIQQSDIDGIRSAYDDLDDGKVIQGTGLLGLITKTVERVEPNN